MTIAVMKPKSFHAAIVDRLAGSILKEAPGMPSQLPTEADLCAAMGVSRTILREAVKTLCAKGMLATGPRLGTRIQPPSAWNLLDPDVIRWRLEAGVDETFVRDILELRLAIEPEAASLAARRAEGHDLAALSQALRDMENAVDESWNAESGRGYLEADLAFHETILAATHNQFFVALTPAIDALLRVSFRFSVKSRASARSSLPLHRAVLDAIAGRDPDGAERALRCVIAAARSDVETDMARDDFLMQGEPEIMRSEA
jgi:DNA-binding FadR family transcriptional regulator